MGLEGREGTVSMCISLQKGEGIGVGEWGGERKGREGKGKKGGNGGGGIRVSETEQHVRVYGIRPP